MADITRRKCLTLLTGGAAGAAAAAGAGCQETKVAKKLRAFKNEEFCDADGTFNQEAAKKAYYELMAYHGYPAYESLKEVLWVLDFAVGRFTDVGMGGVFWLNEWVEEGKYGYLGHEIFLLPGQMIPEHWHVQHEDIPPKMEGWHCRYGETILFDPGEESPDAKTIIPASELEFTTCHKVTRVAPGEVGKLTVPEAPHFQVAGPEGAIVSEYASYHSMDALRFRNPDIKLD